MRKTRIRTMMNGLFTVICVTLLQSLVAADPLLSVFRASPTPTVLNFELQAIERADESSAVFVLFGGPDVETDSVTNRGWLEFCRKNKLTFVIVKLRVVPQANFDEVAAELSRFFDKGLAKVLGSQSGGCLGYSAGAESEWLLRTIFQQPQRWYFWGACNPTYLPVVPREMENQRFPSGILFSGDQNRVGAATMRFVSRQLRQGKMSKVTEVRSSGPQADPNLSQRFYSQFVSSMIAAKNSGSGLWVSKFDETLLSSGKPPTEDYSWLPDQELQGAWELLNSKEVARNPLFQETFQSDSGKQTLLVEAPIRSFSSKESLHSPSLLLWFSDQSSIEGLQKSFATRMDPLLSYARTTRMPVVSWASGGVWPSRQLHQSSSLDAQVAVSDARFADLREELIETINRLCLKHGWPTERWLLAGDGAAARYAARLLKESPQLFMGAHLHCATGLEEYTELIDVPILLTTGASDLSFRSSLSYYKSAAGSEAVLFRRYSFPDHRIHWSQKFLSATFFDNLLSSSGKDASLSRVPNSGPNSEDSGVGVYADVRSGRIISDAEKVSVPELWRLKFPSWPLAEAWQYSE